MYQLQINLASYGRQFTYLFLSSDQLDIPICEGCGAREQECWLTCQDEKGAGNERGFCEKCNSHIGTKGACCMLNNPDDPEECQAVPESSFLYTTYHMCVLVPGNIFNIRFLLEPKVI